MRHDINVVLEAAQIRATQWRHVANGRDVLNDDVVDELFDCAPEEAASIAEEQEAAIDRVRASLPTGGGRYDLDALALAAMCLWEHALLVQSKYDRHASVDEPLTSWLADGEGAWAARQGCWTLAAMAEAGWDAVNVNGDPPPGFDAYDWDWIPVWLEALYIYCELADLKVTDVTEELAVSVARSLAATVDQD